MSEKRMQEKPGTKNQPSSKEKSNSNKDQNPSAPGIKGALTDKSIKYKSEADEKPLKTLVEFLDKFVDRKGKILASDKKKFDSLERDLNEEQKTRLISLFTNQDKDLKYCLTLSEFLLEGSIESAARQALLNFIERVLSEYSLLSRIKINSVLQVWLDSSAGVSDKLGFFERQFRAQKKKGKKGKEQKFSDSQIGTLLCIASVWLYFKKESDFDRLTRYLSQSAFKTDGQSISLIEPQAFAFAASMISSNKKKKFAYFLAKVSDTEKKLSQRLQIKTDESSWQGARLAEQTTKIESLSDRLSSLEHEKQALSDKVTYLEADIEILQEKARHRNTHHEDSKDGLKIMLKNILQGELRDVLEKAQKAHAKGKNEVVEYQINDALDILHREIKRVDNNG